jgi:flavodoxin
MKVEIVYDSSTGTTANASRTMAQIMEGQGHSCQVNKLSQADPDALAEADLICIGTWVKGWFIIRQHPTEGTMRFIERMDDLAGKSVVVFCTYKLATGSTLSQMAAKLEGKGADVVAKFKYRGSEPDKSFHSFVSSLS